MQLGTVQNILKINIIRRKIIVKDILRNYFSNFRVLNVLLYSNILNVISKRLRTISCLLVVQQSNELLMKIKVVSTSSAPLLEAYDTALIETNAISRHERENKCERNYGQKTINKILTREQF